MKSQLCTKVSLPNCPVQRTVYGYYPSLSANAFFCAWFGVFLLLNLILGIRYKTWTYMLALTLGCLTEIIGYIGRIMMHYNPWSVTGFQMQICCIILGPAFNSAAIYLTLKHIALTFGPQYSLIRPAWYTYIFITCDLVSLVLQGLGGGLAATAGTNKHQQNLGTNIMITGIAFQVAVLLAFGTVASIYIHRRWTAARRGGDKLSLEAATTLSNTKFRLFAIGITTAFIAIFGRCVYRIAEMAGGWGNHIMRDQASFIALEGGFIAYAICAQTIFHPGFCFPQMRTERKPLLSPPQEKEQIGQDGMLA